VAMESQLAVPEVLAIRKPVQDKCKGRPGLFINT
jgi:hypothetical protein